MGALIRSTGFYWRFKNFAYRNVMNILLPVVRSSYELRDDKAFMLTKLFRRISSRNRFYKIIGMRKKWANRVVSKQLAMFVGR